MSEPAPSTSTKGNKLPGHDIFCTPENSHFMSQAPYRDLSPTEKEIRLLKILPDSRSGFVECELLPAVPLVKVQKQYLALSYCAGSAKETKPIKVNGIECRVFANLHHALEAARHYWETYANPQDFLLWVDQVCINQFDLTERSHQVSFMRDIYENATETLICLSTSDADKDGLARLASLDTTIVSAYFGDDNDSILDTPEMEQFLKCCVDVCGIFLSPWWGRAWVFQEFMVSAQSTFLHKRHAMTYDDFAHCADNIYAMIQYALSNDEEIGIKQRLKQKLILAGYTRERIEWPISRVANILRAKKQQPTTSDLKRLLFCTQDCQSSDERDRIYSLLGLAHPEYGVLPDYSPDNNIEKLLLETSRKIITVEDSLYVLSYLPDSTTLSSNSRGLLPSWVIDWTKHTSIARYYYDHDNCETSVEKMLQDPELAGNASVDFVQVPHPEYPGMTTTTLQAWGVQLDTDFHEKINPVIGLLKLQIRLFEGSRHYSIVSSDPVESDHELWILYGACEPFLLKRYSYGYKIVRAAECTNLRKFEDLAKLSLSAGLPGDANTAKTERKRIMLF